MLHRPSLHHDPMASSSLFGCAGQDLAALTDPVLPPQHSIDRTRAVQPWLAFTGHTVRGGNLGRTEPASDPQQGARALYRTAKRLNTLPDFLQSYSGPFGGSVCGRKLTSSTLGFERRCDSTFAINDEETFVAMMLQDIPPRPVNFEVTRALNSGYVPVSVP